MVLRSNDDDDTEYTYMICKKYTCVLSNCVMVESAKRTGSVVPTGRVEQCPQLEYLRIRFFVSGLSLQKDEDGKECKSR